MLFADSIPPVIKWRIVRSDSCSFSESVIIDSAILCDDTIDVGGVYNYPVSRNKLKFKEYKETATYPIDDTVITICMIIIAIMLFIMLFVIFTLIFGVIVEAVEKEKK